MSRKERQEFFKLIRFAFFGGMFIGLMIITTPGI